mgnify:CR=1 FL=1
MKSILLKYISMELQYMTPADWAGVLVTVVTFVAMSIAYFKVFHPKNKTSLESHRYHLIDYDRDIPYSGREQK